jgi:hypothetical protein
MEELFELQAYIEQGRYAEALQLVEEMEEMAKDDKINKIYSFTVIMLLHLIKQHAEKRTTRSWEYAIWNASRQIRRVNTRRKAGGCYLSEQELGEVRAEAYPEACKRAVLEACEGQYTEAQLATMVDRAQIQQEARVLMTSDQG